MLRVAKLQSIVQVAEASILLASWRTFTIRAMKPWLFRVYTWIIIPGLGYVVNSHGDHKSPKDRVVGPLPNGNSWLINGGDPNHLLTTVTGMILEVGGYTARTYMW